MLNPRTGVEVDFYLGQLPDFASDILLLFVGTEDPNVTLINH